MVIKKNQIKISPNDQTDYPVNSVINLSYSLMYAYKYQTN